jgi:hypothetical protein
MFPAERAAEQVAAADGDTAGEHGSRSHHQTTATWTATSAERAVPLKKIAQDGVGRDGMAQGDLWVTLK